MMHVERVKDRSVFTDPGVVALLDRAFSDPKFGVNAYDVLAYLYGNIEDADTQFFLAHDERHGHCGFSVMTYAPWPLGPNPCIAHFHVDVPEARVPLVNACFGWVWSKGIRHCTIVNATGRSNEAHMRLFRRYGKGRVVGSVINYDLGDRTA